MVYVLVLRMDTARHFLEQYLKSEVSRVSSIEIAPDFEISRRVEHKRVTIKSSVDCGDELLASSLEDGMLSRWKEFLKKEEATVVTL